MYSLVFTSLPVVVAAIADQDLRYVRLSYMCKRVCSVGNSCTCGSPVVEHYTCTLRTSRANTLLADHTYYEEGQRSKVYTKWKFWLAMLDAFYQSAVVFFVAYGVCINFKA